MNLKDARASAPEQVDSLRKEAEVREADLRQAKEQVRCLAISLAQGFLLSCLERARMRPLSARMRPLSARMACAGGEGQDRVSRCLAKDAGRPQGATSSPWHSFFHRL
jgi:hypothetical protein